MRAERGRRVRPRPYHDIIWSQPNIIYQKRIKSKSISTSDRGNGSTMARRAKATHEILPTVTVSVCVRDIEMYNIPSVRSLMGDRNLAADAKHTYIPPFRVYAYSGTRTGLVCITDVKGLREELRLSPSSIIRVDLIENFTRLSSSQQDLLRQYCGNIAPHRMTPSAAQVYKLLSENPEFLDYFAGVLNVRRRDILQFDHVRRFFPHVSRSSWQAQLQEDEKRPYRRRKAGPIDPPDPSPKPEPEPGPGPDAGPDRGMAAPKRARSHSDQAQSGTR